MGLLDGGIANIAHGALKGLFFDAVLERDVETAQSPARPHDPAPAGAPAEFTCKALIVEYTNFERTNPAIKGGDRKVLILAASFSPATEPQPNDRITLQGETLAIVDDAGAVRRDPATATWECQGRK